MQELSDKMTGGTLTADEWNEVPKEIENIIEATQQSLSEFNLNQLGQGIAEYVAHAHFYSSAINVDTYELTQINVNLQDSANYRDGMVVRFVADTNSPADARVQILGLGAAFLILKPDLTQVEADYILAGDLVAVRFRAAGGAWILDTGSSARFDSQVGKGIDGGAAVLPDPDTIVQRTSNSSIVARFIIQDSEPVENSGPNTPIQHIFMENSDQGDTGDGGDGRLRKMTVPIFKEAIGVNFLDGGIFSSNFENPGFFVESDSLRATQFITAGSSLTAGTFITATGNVTSTTGNLVCTVGDIICSANDIRATNGEVEGNIITSNTTITATGNIQGGSIASTSTITAVGDITAFVSDKRLKNEVEKLDPQQCMESILGWSTVRYRFSDDANKLTKGVFNSDETHLGFYVQDIESDYPELTAPAPFDVDRETGKSISGDNYKTLKYDKTPVIMAAGMKYLHDEIQALKDEITKLKEQL